jgi:hypothetical protein
LSKGKGFGETTTNLPRHIFFFQLSFPLFFFDLVLSLASISSSLSPSFGRGARDKSIIDRLSIILHITIPTVGRHKLTVKPPIYHGFRLSLS